jgi:DnaK suppressor protein
MLSREAGLNEIEKFKHALEVEQEKLLARHRRAENLAIQNILDSMEGVLDSVDELRTAMSSECSEDREVKEALERIAAGTYGVCLHCRQPISPRRLALLPWAALCINCQGAAEKRSNWGRGLTVIGPSGNSRGVYAGGFPAPLSKRAGRSTAVSRRTKPRADSPLRPSGMRRSREQVAAIASPEPEQPGT